MISIFKYYYELTNFNVFYIIQSITVLSFLSSVIFPSFLPLPLSQLSQFCPVEATSCWLCGHCDTNLLTFDKFLILMLQDVSGSAFKFPATDMASVIFLKGHKRLAKLKNAMLLHIYNVTLYITYQTM